VVASALFENLRCSGIECRVEMNKEVAFVIDAIRSWLSAYYGICHPLQSVAREQFGTSGGCDTEPAYLDAIVPHREMGDRPPQSFDEVDRRIAEFVECRIDGTTEVLMTLLFGDVELVGFTRQVWSYEEDITLVDEAIRSLLLRHYGREHPLVRKCDWMPYRLDVVSRDGV
jgi:hypothetical protein